MRQNSQQPQFEPDLAGSEPPAAGSEGEPPGDKRPSSADSAEPAGGERTATATMDEPIQLPQSFVVKYLGKREAEKLWGIKYTRGPVDEMVATAKAMRPGQTLPLLQLNVSDQGVNITEMKQNLNKNFEAGNYPIDVISYGVQDIVFTRVFAMILVRENTPSPFECHAFVCDRRESARKLTFALATAFQEFSKRVKREEEPRKFAIDLRSPDEIEAELRGQHAQQDSEA
ncbi:Low density lipoprotein receptor adapter protein 1 [Amphibalanus amphitrite]|uniref:Low density lipoprotein receptor adapter protein 1 n=1 Tax=Amphibalanus amphitrite TaxID=1232801 RepID=A0A6A4VQM2_AMPAM|nr:low density lipoprotein receptor adapter protein 1-like [Amphibalanus amphitrite]KAF0293710.1 Low density lipoprotein receptor adapter protein 1 [Amphibalanus amphitrite]